MKKNFLCGGEVYIKKSAFFKLNEQLSKEDKATFANPRNFASGSLRQLDPQVTKGRNLSYFVWGGRLNGVTTQKDMMDKFKDLGFIVNENSLTLNNVDDIMGYYQKMYEARKDLDYDIDGLVYKVNVIEVQNKLGNITKAPRWAVAHKFPAAVAITTIEKISVQVGRTGAITPVAHLKPVNIGGVLVTKASLHNEEEMKRKDVRIGDVVLIKRAGDVIPQIIEVDYSKRVNDTPRFIFPKVCPVCQSAIKTEDDEVVKRCSGGMKCKAQVIEIMCHFVSKDAFNIEGLSLKKITYLYNVGIIKLPVDIFRLQEADEDLAKKIINFDGWGELSYQNLLHAIEKAKDIEFARFIYALGIRHVGLVSAELLAKHFGNVKDFLFLSQKESNDSDLLGIKGIGPKTAESVVNFLLDEDNVFLVKEVVKYVRVKEQRNYQIKQSLLKDKTVVFTGVLQKFTRSEVKELAKNMGAKVNSTISKKTDYLVVGKESGNKLTKAQNLGIKLINEEEFEKMISMN